MKEKALIKETGEIFDIVERYMKSYVNTTFSFDDLGKVDFEKPNFDSKPLGKFCKLSNNNEYKIEELVIGTDNIREYKLKGIV